MVAGQDDPGASRRRHQSASPGGGQALARRLRRYSGGVGI